MTQSKRRGCITCVLMLLAAILLLTATPSYAGHGRHGGHGHHGDRHDRHDYHRHHDRGHHGPPPRVIHRDHYYPQPVPAPVMVPTPVPVPVPAPAPVIVRPHRYRFYPKHKLYYDVSRDRYFHYEGGAWRLFTSNPLINIQLGPAFSFEMNSDRPYTSYSEHVEIYRTYP